MLPAATLDLPPFPGFRPEAFAFLRDLARHNERDWFKPRKEHFEDEVLWPFRCLVADAARQAAHEGLPLTGDPKRSIFRIYRDTRFSKNKKPYKTHVGAVLSRTGERRASGVLYLHVEPGKSYLGAGFWRPETPLLRAWRRRLADRPEEFLIMREALAAQELTLTTDDTLKRLPRGFDAPEDEAVAAALRWKSFTTARPVPDEALRTPNFTQDVLQMMRDAHPLLAFGWQIEDAWR